MTSICKICGKEFDEDYVEDDICLDCEEE